MPSAVFRVVIGNDALLWLWPAPVERIVHEKILVSPGLFVAGDQDEMSNTLSGPLDENADRELIIDLRLNLRKCHRAPVLRIRDGSSACRQMIYRQVGQG